MPVTLRKRKAPEPAPAPPPKKAAAAPKASKASKAAPKAAPKAKEPVAAKPANGTAKTKKPAVDDVITIDGFGGEVETNDGETTTLKALLEESKAGVVLFTYPKASTPGCTTQVCLFRDSYESLTAKGLAIYGLSADSPKANTTFKTKQKLPYALLCDPQRTLIDAIGLKGVPSKTTRGVFVVDKEGKVLAAEPGGPAATLEVVKRLAVGLEDVAADAAATNGDAKEEEKPAEEKTEEKDAEEKPAEEKPAEDKEEKKADEEKPAEEEKADEKESA